MRSSESGVAESQPLVTAEQLAYLRGVDSPTIANAIEVFKVRDRCEGFIGGAIRDLSPELGVMVGYALTVMMTSSPGPVASRDGYWRMWEALEQAPKPAVMVVHDVSGAPSRCAYWGEVMATLATRLGAVGVVADAGVRDLPEVRAIGLHYFAPYAVVSHGNFEIVNVGDPVTVDGQVVRTGDLLHGDENGIVVVPHALVARLPAEVENVRTREQRVMEHIKSPAFSLASLRQMQGY
jgi:4-hydroxy-4-methyl-2-oxoglutarate aldolase